MASSGVACPAGVTVVISPMRMITARSRRFRHVFVDFFVGLMARRQAAHASTLTARSRLADFDNTPPQLCHFGQRTTARVNGVSAHNEPISGAPSSAQPQPDLISAGSAKPIPTWATVNRLSREMRSAMFNLRRKLREAKIVRQHRETMKAFEARIERAREKHQAIRQIEAERERYMLTLLKGRMAHA